jgi:hypothetical protein
MLRIPQGREGNPDQTSLQPSREVSSAYGGLVFGLIFPSQKIRPRAK